MSYGTTEEIEVPDTPKPGSDQADKQRDADPTKPKPQPAKFIRRSDWGAKPPKWIEALQTPVKKVVLTWTETDPCNTEEECIQRVKEIQTEHMKDEKCPDIRHNFLVGGDGAIYEGRGYTRVGPPYPKSERTHEELYGKSLEIAFIQRHAGSPPYKLIKGASDCIAYSALPELRWVEEKFTLFWVRASNVLNRHNASLTKEGDLLLQAAG